MDRTLNRVVVADAVRTPFGSSGLFHRPHVRGPVDGRGLCRGHRGIRHGALPHRGGGVEHMGHLPMGFMRNPHPRLEDAMGGPSAFNMDLTAENIHDRFPEFTREMANRYAVECRQKADRAIQALYFMDRMGMA